MTQTYGLGHNTDLNKVRLLIGDTNVGSTQTPLFQDEEIDDFLELESSIEGAAAIACQSLAARFAGDVTKSVGELSIALSDKAKAYAQMSLDFRKLSKSKGSVSLYAGGISRSDKASQQSDSDWERPYFETGMHDFEITTLSS